MTWKNSLRCLVALYFLLIMVTYGIYVYHMIEKKVVTDFVMFYSAAHYFWVGKALYGGIDWSQYKFTDSTSILLPFAKEIASLGYNFSCNLNPPFFILLTLPLGLLSYKTALFFWEVFSFFLTLGGVWILYKRLFTFCSEKFFGFIVLSSIFLASMPSQINMTLGQNGMLIFFLVMLIWAWTRPEGEPHDLKAGIFLGVCLAMKYFLGLIWLFFLFQRRWKLVFSAILSFLVCNAIAYAVLGKAAFVQHMEILHVVDWFASSWNASLYGFLIRLGGYVDGTGLHVAWWVSLIYYGFCIFFIGYQWVLSAKKITEVTRYDYVFSYVLLSALLICPLGWVYYFGFLMMPLMLIFRLFVAQGAYVKLPMIFIFVFTLGLLSLPTKIVVVSMATLLNFSFTLSAYFYGLMLLLGVWIYFKKPLLTFNSDCSGKQWLLFPWTLLSYLAVSLGFYMLVYGAFFKTPKPWS